MAPHHIAWLSAHPDRTPEWLARQLADGFHVHHTDADHSNNDPANLVLIEGVDHFRLHNRPGFLRASLGEAQDESRKAKRDLGEQAYAMMADRVAWYVIERKLAYGAGTLWALAKEHALTSGKQWPLPAPATAKRRIISQLIERGKAEVQR